MAGKRYRTVGRLLYACGACSEQSKRFDRYPNNPEGRMRALRAAFASGRHDWLFAHVDKDLADRIGPAFATMRNLRDFFPCGGSCVICDRIRTRLTPVRATPAARARLVKETYAALQACAIERAETEARRAELASAAV